MQGLFGVAFNSAGIAFLTALLILKRNSESSAQKIGEMFIQLIGTDRQPKCFGLFKDNQTVQKTASDKFRLKKTYRKIGTRKPPPPPAGVLPFGYEVFRT